MKFKFGRGLIEEKKGDSNDSISFDDEDNTDEPGDDEYDISDEELYNLFSETEEEVEDPESELQKLFEDDITPKNTILKDYLDDLTVNDDSDWGDDDLDDEYEEETPNTKDILKTLDDLTVAVTNYKNILETYNKTQK